MKRIRILSLCAAAALCLSLLSACGGPRGDSPPTAPRKDADLAAFAQTVQESHEFAAMEKASSSAMAGYMNRRAAKGAMRRANRAMAMAVIDSTTS